MVVLQTTTGTDLSAFAAILAAAGFAVGMALQGTLGNFAAGVMLLMFRPFKVDDYIVVADTAGAVEEIDRFIHHAPEYTRQSPRHHSQRRDFRSQAGKLHSQRSSPSRHQRRGGILSRSRSDSCCA